MENLPDHQNVKSEGCRCGGGNGRCGCGSCWAKIAIGLWLLLVGAIGGYAMGKCCGSRYRHAEMMSCPVMDASPQMPAK